jgi:hypothetical protein
MVMNIIAADGGSSVEDILINCNCFADKFHGLTPKCINVQKILLLAPFGMKSEQVILSMTYLIPLLLLNRFVTLVTQLVFSRSDNAV